MNAPLKALDLEDPVALHARAMLEALGEDPRREGLSNTPARYATAMRYLTHIFKGQNARRVREGRHEVDHAGCLFVDRALQLIRGCTASYTNLNQYTTGDSKCLIVHEAVRPLNNKLVLQASGIWQARNFGEVIPGHTCRGL